MSNRSDRAKEQELAAQQARLNAEATADRTAARTLSPVQQEQESQALGWFNFLKDPNRDFSKTPGMAFNDAGEEGAAGAEEDRTALGAMQFGAAGADPNLQAVLKANMGERRTQRRGQALEGQISRYDMLMRGLGSEVAASDAARRMGMAGMTTSAGANATNAWSAFQPRPHWGLSAATALIGGAGQALSGRV